MENGGPAPPSLRRRPGRIEREVGSLQQLITFVSCLKQAVHEVVSSTVPGLAFTAENLEVKKDREIPLTSGVFIIIGMTGKIRGRMIYRLDSRSALALANKMIGGQETILGEFATSALCEITNMVSGRTLASPEFGSLNVDITPPTLFSGKSITLQSLKIDVILLPFHFQGGRLEVFVAVEEFSGL